MDAAPATVPKGKTGMKKNEINNIYVNLFTGVKSAQLVNKFLRWPQLINTNVEMPRMISL